MQKSALDSKVIVQNSLDINNTNGGRDITVKIGTGSAASEISGIIHASTISHIAKKGAGDLILSGANTYSGETVIDAGRIVLGNNLALQNSPINTDNVGKIDATGHTTPTFGGLKGAANLSTLINSGYSGINTLTLNTANTDAALTTAGKTLTTFSGAITEGATGMNLVKTGIGTQSLTGTNTYTGNTTVTTGTLSLGNATLNTSLADASIVRIETGATLDLNFLPTHSDTVDMLFICGVQKEAGIWGSSISGAPNTDPHLTGTGTLTVTSGTGTFAGWITGIFAGGATVPLDKRGPNDDPDNDGISNLVEYAIADLDPTVSNGSLGILSGKTITFSKRQPLPTDLTYAIEESTDLGAAHAWTEVTPTVNDGTTISHTLPDTATKDFMRLKVTQTP